MATALGKRYVEAVAAKDRERLAAVLDPAVDGRNGWMRVLCSGFRPEGGG